MARVVLEHLDKVYPNGHEAIRDLNLDVQSGELFVLVGPSGSGKTTLLRMIAGLEPVTRGRILFNDRPIHGLASIDRNVAMVFQTPALYPHLTVYGNMAFSLALRRIPRAAIRQKVLEMARLLEIEHLLRRKPRELSGGQAQRVALGRALVRRPECSLFDEPLSSLDARLRIELRTGIKRMLSRQGITAIYVTHDQEEAMTLGSRIAVLHEGRVQQTGGPLDVYQHPRTRFVAGFLGSPPMNFFEGTVFRADGRIGLALVSQRLAVPGWAASVLADRAGSRVVLGVRPEAIGLRPRPEPAGNATRARRVPGDALQGVVHLVEPLGERTDVHFTVGDGPQLVARVESRDAPPLGAVATLHLDLERVHFFAPDSGENLCAGSQGSRENESINPGGTS